MLAAVLGPLHRRPEPRGRPRHQHLLGPGVHDLHPEAAAHVGGDHLDPVDRQRRAWRRSPARTPVEVWVEVCTSSEPVVGVPAGEHALALQRHRRAALDRRGPARASAAPASIAASASPVCCTITAATLPGTSSCTRSVGGAGALDADDGGQQARSRRGSGRRDVLGDVAVVATTIATASPTWFTSSLGQRVRRAAVGQRRVRDQQRQRLGHPGAGRGRRRCRPRRAPSTSSAAVTSTSRIRACACGLRTNGRLERVVPEVVEEPPVAARPAAASSTRGTRSPNILVVTAPPPRAPASSSAARCTASTMLTGSRCSGTGCRRSPRGPRVGRGRVLAQARR